MRRRSRYWASDASLRRPSVLPKKTKKGANLKCSAPYSSLCTHFNDRGLLGGGPRKCPRRQGTPRV